MSDTITANEIEENKIDEVIEEKKSGRPKKETTDKEVEMMKKILELEKKLQEKEIEIEKKSKYNDDYLRQEKHLKEHSELFAPKNVATDEIIKVNANNGKTKTIQVKKFKSGIVKNYLKAVKKNGV